MLAPDRPNALRRNTANTMRRFQRPLDHPKARQLNSRSATQTIQLHKSDKSKKINGTLGVAMSDSASDLSRRFGATCPRPVFANRHTLLGDFTQPRLGVAIALATLVGFTMAKRVADSRKHHVGQRQSMPPPRAKSPTKRCDRAPSLLLYRFEVVDQREDATTNDDLRTVWPPFFGTGLKTTSPYGHRVAVPSCPLTPVNRMDNL